MLNQIKNEYEFNQFNGLCERAKKILFDWFMSGNDGYIEGILNGDILNNRLTPIEQIFNVCFRRYVHENIGNEIIFGTPKRVMLLDEFSSQVEIETAERNYKADFVIDLSLYKKGLKYIIELAGYEYHSNKKQVNSDYEREQNLQLVGYKVIRFTGSQIYNSPYCCVEKVVKMIFNDMGDGINGDI